MIEVTLPNPAIYAAMGEDNIIAMVRAVYRNLAKSSIAEMFPSNEADLMAAADKSALFWITACGGPPLYQQKFGHPRMRARHLPFVITEARRQAWVEAWKPVLAVAPEQFNMPIEHRASFLAYIESFSTWMVNS